MASRGGGAAALIVIIVAVLGLTSLAHRKREWVHGGAEVSVSKQLRVADLAHLPDAVAELGGPWDKPPHLPGVTQGLVLRLDWTGPGGGGRYHVIVLDNRARPPCPLPPFVVWTFDPNGDLLPAETTDWTGAYDTLAEHYLWLVGTASTQDASGDEAPRNRAVAVPATTSGSVLAIYLVDKGTPPFTDPAAEVLVVLFYVDGSGEVRWARSV
ncbi:MAG: hypothetical protein FWJ93_02060 [Micromonosporaceae bacterium]